MEFNLLILSAVVSNWEFISDISEHIPDSSPCSFSVVSCCFSKALIQLSAKFTARLTTEPIRKLTPMDAMAAPKDFKTAPALDVRVVKL